nr:MULTISPECIES: hypothetical protein [unclassified Streptomyces]
MALAAMPTAVLMGMGLAPSPALADEKDVPFAPGPCVTRSDEPVAEETTATPTAKATETAKPEPTATATATATKPAEPTGEPTATPSATATPTATASPSTTTAVEAAQGGAQAAAAEAAPTATPTPTKSVNPLDPLGVGDALKDFFGGLAPQQEPTATATPTPTPSATTAAPQQKATAADETQAPAAKSDTTDTKAADTKAADTKAAETKAAETKAAIKEAAEKAGVEVQELPKSAQGLEAKPDTDIPDGAKPRFPCPERDDAALAAAELEPGVPLLPDEPWRLESSLLTLSGLKYHGIVEVKTYGGKVKKVLKFTATYVGIKDLHQITEHSEGREGHVRSKRGSTSTITNGTVTMYTEELKGNLLGIIPITFGPESPPPVDLPAVFFTNVKLKQAGQFGGTLKVEDLRNTIEPI